MVEHSLALVATEYLTTGRASGLYPYPYAEYAANVSKPAGKLRLTLSTLDFQGDVNHIKISASKEQERLTATLDRNASQAQYDAAKAVPE